MCPCPGWFQLKDQFFDPGVPSCAKVNLCHGRAAIIGWKSAHEYDGSAWRREAPITRYHMSEPFPLFSVDPPIYTDVLLIADIMPGCQVSSAVEAATAVRNSKIPRRCVEHQWSCWKGCSFLCFRLSNLEHDINEANEVNIQSTHHIRTYSQQQNKTQFAHFGLATNLGPSFDWISGLRGLWHARAPSEETVYGFDFQLKKKSPRFWDLKLKISVWPFWTISFCFWSLKVPCEEFDRRSMGGAMEAQNHIWRSWNIISYSEIRNIYQIFRHFVVSFIILYAYIIVYLHSPPDIGFATFIRFSTETLPGLAYLARPRATAGTPQWVLPCVQPGQTQDAQDQRIKPCVMWSCDAKPPLIPCWFTTFWQDVFWKKSLKTLIQGWLSCFFSTSGFPSFLLTAPRNPFTRHWHHFSVSLPRWQEDCWQNISWTGCTTPFVRSLLQYSMEPSKCFNLNLG